MDRHELTEEQNDEYIRMEVNGYRQHLSQQPHPKSKSDLLQAHHNEKPEIYLEFDARQDDYPLAGERAATRLELDMDGIDLRVIIRERLSVRAAIYFLGDLRDYLIEQSTQDPNFFGKLVRPVRVAALQQNVIEKPQLRHSYIANNDGDLGSGCPLCGAELDPDIAYVVKAIVDIRDGYMREAGGYLCEKCIAEIDGLAETLKAVGRLDEEQAGREPIHLKLGSRHITADKLPF